MSLVHRHAEALREVAELKAQIGVLRAGYNCALKERDNLKAELARSVKHGQGVVEISNQFGLQVRTLEATVVQLQQGKGLEPCTEEHGCEPGHKCCGAHRTMAEVCAKLHGLEKLARECIMSQGEYLCEACSKVTRELRDDPAELALYKDHGA